MALTDIRRSAPTGAARPAAARPPRRAARPVDPWSRTLLVAAALASALAGLHVTLQGISWWLVGTLLVIGVLASAAATRRLLRGRLWPPIVSAFAGLVLLTLCFGADTAVLGVIPMPATFGRFAQLVAAGIDSIVEQVVPATPEPGIVLLVAVLMAACAWVADVVVAVRRPALVAVPLGAILVVPSAVLAGLGDVLWYVVTAALFLAILRFTRPRDSRGMVLVTGALVVLGSLLLPYALPAVDEQATRSSGGLTAGINPFVTLGDDLRRGEPTLALRYTTSATEPVYLRLTTLDIFTGKSWGPSLGDANDEGLGAFPSPPGLDAATPVTAAEVDVKVAGLVSTWLPTPYPTSQIRGAHGDWFWEPQGLTVRSLHASARGQEYVAQFLQVDPTAAQLAATVPVIPLGVDGPLSLPDDTPQIILDTAHAVADPAASAYDKALALQNYLRSAPFTYSEQTPVDEGFDGSGLDALAVFLDRKTGYCVHYASAMAVMARALGIPSRIAVGFQPGERHFEDGENVFEVSTDDLHAWPELYFEGVGWLRFEPTPGRGSVPSYGGAPVDDPATPEDESTQAPTAAPTTAPQNRPDVDPGPPDVEQPVVQLGSTVLTVLGVLVAVVVVVLAPAGLRVGIRMRRMRRIRLGRDPAAAAWDEVRDTARDVGWSAPQTETVRALAARLAPESGGDALGALGGSVELAAYARPDAAALSAAQLAAARRSILRAVGVRARLRAFLLPPSLLHRWLPDRDA